MNGFLLVTIGDNVMSYLTPSTSTTFVDDIDTISKCLKRKCFQNPVLQLAYNRHNKDDIEFIYAVSDEPIAAMRRYVIKRMLTSNGVKLPFIANWVDVLACPGFIAVMTTEGNHDTRYVTHLGKAVLLCNTKVDPTVKEVIGLTPADHNPSNKTPLPTHLIHLPIYADRPYKEIKGKRVITPNKTEAPVDEVNLSIEGLLYPSFKAACDALDIDYVELKSRVDSDSTKYKDWLIIT